ncbi:MAG: hypothetical protein K0S33_2217 [Bacteroidetes bacterium]|jgi:hypothetical protein|nr:hypothetical protein [Bacteroidota bacterium]
MQNKLRLHITCIVLFVFGSLSLWSQCGTTTISGNYTVNADIILSGIYNVSGEFKIPAGITVYVKPFSSGACGTLEIHAQKITILGTINGDYAGKTGGTGGPGGSLVSSITGDITALDDCSNKDNTGVVMIAGGSAGNPGTGNGLGLAGQNGQTGSGPKQQCLNNDDECGMIGGASGAGGGGGGSYGGAGTPGGNGGNGSDAYVATDVNVSTAYPVVGGTGTAGGNAGSTYGTISGTDIDLGSGGAGAGGGGRSFATGLQGGNGGAGGGLVKLIASDSVKINGSISVNGANGAAGGIGGNGGISTKCCSDGCDDAGEETMSCGAGGGGGAGGGSGGGIYIETQTAALISGTLNSKGGNGGNGGSKGIGTSDSYSGGIFCGTQSLSSSDGNNGDKGGAGGGGRIKIFAPVCAASSVTPLTNLQGGTGLTSGTAGTYTFVCSPVSLQEQEKELFALTVFPNPATEQISLQFKNTINPEKVSDITIYSLMGQLITSQDGTDLKTNGSQAIDVSMFPAGMYFIKVTINSISYDYRFIKN